MRGLTTALIVVGVLWASPTYAHQQGLSFSDVRTAGGEARFDLVLSLHDLSVDVDGDGSVTDAEIRSRHPRLGRLFDRALEVAAGGERCPLTLEDSALVPPEAVRFRLRGPCRDVMPVRVVVRLEALTAVEGQNLATIRVGDVLAEHVFTRTDTEVLVGEASGAWSTFRRFFVLGIEHIATGYDHVLFLLALLLVGGGWRALVAIVTAFTVAHSLTLTLAVLDVVQLPPRLVESVIALSIAWVALENILVAETRGRWRITFVFGLVHGFGFASILREMHLPAAGLVTSLLAFNLGVEAGQLVVVLIASPLIALLARSPHRRTIVAVASAAILVMALWWFGERALG